MISAHYFVAHRDSALTVLRSTARLNLSRVSYCIRNHARILALSWLLAAMPAQFAFAQMLPDKPAGYVTDVAHVLSDATRASLESELAALDASTTEQIAVVTVPDMGGDYIEHYAADLFQKWGIGQAKTDNGVLLLLAIKERELRIEVGYGLEGALPDSVANSIIERDMTPLLKQGDYDGAVRTGVARITEAVRGEYQAGPAAADSVDPFAFAFLGLMVFQWIAALLGASRSWWLGGIVGAAGGAIVSTIFGWWIFGGLGFVCLMALAGLLLDYVVSHEVAHPSANSPWWTGGGGFGGRSRGGGFGGFGGGMSGGGGASGRW